MVSAARKHLRHHIEMGSVCESTEASTQKSGKKKATAKGGLQGSGGAGGIEPPMHPSAPICASDPCDARANHLIRGALACFNMPPRRARGCELDYRAQPITFDISSAPEAVRSMEVLERTAFTERSVWRLRTPDPSGPAPQPASPNPLC